MELIVPPSWDELASVRGVSLLIRLGIALTPLAAIGCTELAGDTSGLVVLLVVGLAATAAVVPDSHVGLVVVAVMAAQWLAGVDDVATSWSVPAAMALAAFHLLMAAAGVAPPAARWTWPMCRRWLRRSAWVAASAVPIWALTASGPSVGSNRIVVVAALAAVVIGASWSLWGTLRHRHHAR